MEDLNITEESNDEIHIDVEENGKEVKLSQSLESYLQKEIAALPNKNSNRGAIYKVSEKYRKAKEESFTPRVVSIGPLHHGKSYLQSMETVKLKCLTNLTMELGISLKTLSEYATTEEGDVRSYYQDFKFDAKEFSKMILLDGIFIILLISKNQCFSKVNALILKDKTWMLSDVMHDMLLLENQLPLYFVRGLLNMLVIPDPEHTTWTSDSLDSFYEDAFYEDAFYEDLRNHFQDVGITKGLEVNLESKYAWHLVDFLLQLHLPSEENQSLMPGRVDYTGSTSSELQGAGIRFCRPPVEGLFEITFDKRNGKLCIPQVTVNDTTETLFTNLIAFEQSQLKKYITSYVILMYNLMNTAEDVKLLVNKEIIVNSLGKNHQVVADLFKNLYMEVIQEDKDFQFANICNDLSEYKLKTWKLVWYKWKCKWLSWKVTLMNMYFSDPWSVISFVAATLVVVLTIVQTVCAILGLKQGLTY